MDLGQNCFPVNLLSRSPTSHTTCNHQTEMEEETFYNNCRNDKGVGSERMGTDQYWDTISSLWHTAFFQRTTVLFIIIPPSPSQKKWRMIYHAIAQWSPNLQRAVWRQQSFLCGLLRARFSTGVKQHSAMSNGTMPIYIACGFCSFISYISVLSIFQSPP